MDLLFGNLVVILVALGLSQVVLWWFASDRGWGSLTLIGGVIAAYSLDRLLDAPEEQRRRVFGRFVPPLVVGSGAVVAGLVIVPAHWFIVAGLALIAGAYVPLKRVLPKGALTASGWAVAIVWLPCAVTPTLAAGVPIAICVFVIVIANAMLCDALDVDIDRQHGVRGLGPWLGARTVSRIAAVLAIAGGFLAFALGPWPLAAAAIPLAIFGCLPPVRGGPNLQRTALDLVLVLPGIVAAFLPHR